ncbi:hypothetical protein HPP92_014464 [Vanilla planifolia]|uniref:SH2 domain-containing protein n=1 Tax=Vanilla planifolia TaxID=51239 RepID=A0A835QNC9_VANPL|nr:hypothetical protein HPP92_014464 [Vanilla planifolia]
MVEGKCGEEEYEVLNDVRINFDSGGVFSEEGFAGFSLCFWIYLSSSIRSSSVILWQVPSVHGSFSWSDTPHIASQIECPMERWIHIGCKVTQGDIQLYFNGDLDEKSIKDDFIKNPPVKLSVDDSCISDAIEVGSDGVWSIVGGKVIASLVYADTGVPVEKTRDNPEAPLLTSCEGLEYPSTERPVALFLGRATFKLKISQLSSKSDNRLFSICFRTARANVYPFFEAHSHPIRCISRNRFVRPASLGKRQASASPTIDRTPSPRASDKSQAILDISSNGHLQTVGFTGLGTSPPSKQMKIGYEKPSRQFYANENLEQDEKKACTEAKTINGIDSPPSDSGSTDAKHLEPTWIGQSMVPTSDAVIFRYCLEGVLERSLLLKEIIKFSSNEELQNFAEQVCQYSGCFHHRYPILISKSLVHDGNDTWSSICQKGNRALWTTAASEINKRFMSISRSTNRGLSVKDLEVLQRIAGCGEELEQENFDRLWQWLYPVAVALSKDGIHEMWECTLPKWIEGLITMEEAENSLKGPRGMQKPGTFVLRFPTSRSWPHPDSGSLVVTYVGADSALHHKLLCVDFSCDDGKERGPEFLQNVLLEESELSQLGRVVR